MPVAFIVFMSNLMKMGEGTESTKPYSYELRNKILALRYMVYRMIFDSSTNCTQNRVAPMSGRSRLSRELW